MLRGCKLRSNKYAITSEGSMSCSSACVSRRWKEHRLWTQSCLGSKLNYVTYPQARYLISLGFKFYIVEWNGNPPSAELLWKLNEELYKKKPSTMSVGTHYILVSLSSCHQEHEVNLPERGHHTVNKNKWSLQVKSFPKAFIKGITVYPRKGGEQGEKASNSCSEYKVRREKGKKWSIK